LIYLNSISPGCTPRAAASLRIVTKRGFSLPVSNRLIVLAAIPEALAKSSWLINFLSRICFNDGMNIYYHNAMVLTILYSICYGNAIVLLVTIDFDSLN
jgi:hypothetical protein